MQIFIETIVATITAHMHTIGPILGITIVILESIIPVLPLAIFIALNMYAYGMVIGFILSWVGTIIGCLISFMAFRQWFRGYFWRKIENKERFIQLMNYITDIKFNQLVLLMALPFSPAFLINIGAGLSKISFKKFIIATIIGKISIVYFWGYIGTGIIESISNPAILLEMVLMLFIAYIVSRILGKNLNIE